MSYDLPSSEIRNRNVVVSQTLLEDLGRMLAQPRGAVVIHTRPWKSYGTGNLPNRTKRRMRSFNDYPLVNQGRARA